MNIESRHYIQSILEAENQDSREEKGLALDDSNVWSFDFALVSSFPRGLSCLLENLFHLVEEAGLFF